MNLKQRLLGLIFVLIMLLLLIYATISSTREDLSHIYEKKKAQNKHFPAHGRIKEYIVRIKKLQIDVYHIKQSFITWKQKLVENKKRKNITMDVLNQGDQASCSNLTLLFMISSELSHFNRRKVIRATWSNKTYWSEYNNKRGVSFGMIFIVGRSKYDNALNTEIKKESKLFGDLLVLDLEESFYSLSYKVMVCFQWINENCRNYKFLFKGDDDIYVNNHILMNMLHEPKTPQSHLYIGNRMFSSEVIRNGRYGVSRNEYKRDIYPRYNSGGGFVMSRDVVDGIIPYFDWKSPLKIDDAFMGGLVLKAGIDAINDPRFRMTDVGCTYRNDTIVSHTSKKIVIKMHCAKKLNDAALKQGMKYLDTYKTKM